MTWGRAAGLILSVALAAPAAHAADVATLVCKLAGRPRGPARATTITVRSLEVESGLLTAAALRIGKAKRVRLEADALPTIVTVEALNVRTGAEKSGATGTLRLAAGRRTKERVKLEEVPASPQLTPTAAAAPRAAPSGGYIGIRSNDITVSGVDDVVRNGLRDMLYTDLAAMSCYGTRFVAVEVDKVASSWPRSRCPTRRRRIHRHASRTASSLPRRRCTGASWRRAAR